MKTVILSGILAGAVMLSGCNTTQTTTTTTTSDTHRAATVGSEPGVRIINGKRYVFVTHELGSNIPGRWVLGSGRSESRPAKLRWSLGWSELGRGVFPFATRQT